MSTKNKLRTKKLVLIILGVSSLATLGLIASDHIDKFNSNGLAIDPHNDNSSSLPSNIEDSLTNNTNIETKEDTDVIKNKVVMSSAQNLEKYQKVRVLATGYTAGIESTGKGPSHPEYGITYSGVYVRRDLYSTIAADLNIFPIGTILYIPGYGYGVVADIGAAIKGNKIDLYFNTVEDVYKEWGKKQVDVYIIKQGDGKLTEKLLQEYNQSAASKAEM